MGFGMGCEFAQLLRPTISSLIQRIYLNPDAGLLFWIPPSFNINSMADLLLKIAIFFGLVMMKILLFVLERFVPHQDTRKRRTKEEKKSEHKPMDPLYKEKTYIVDYSSGEIDDKESQSGWLGSWLKWCPTSIAMLRQAEKKILSYVKTSIRGAYVNIGPVVGKDDCKIWTISLTDNHPERPPLVMLHGLGAGVALWALNLDGLAATRHVYAVDLLGFGRSSRPVFSTDALDAEREFVQSIEEWRKEMRLDKFILLGHSMGGFLATSYAIRYPSRVSHLILADPWGFPEKPADLSQRYPIPLWVKMIAYCLQPLNPLWGIRIAGPMGPKLIEKVRPDLIRKFAALSGDGDATVAEYIFHCNAQTPSGEAAFHSMMSSFGWAKYPMINRIPSLKRDVPLSMIYGSRSWVDHCPGQQIQQMRPSSYVDVQIIRGAGHHVYADSKDKFNDLVLKACAHTDLGNPLNFDLSPKKETILEPSTDIQLDLKPVEQDEKPSLQP
ncbi:(Lyso)-N-acylphosphatidylethanolamine lipase isoform X2 [Folsomia candida]|nr:(Lyso)-N-acylphosphatidylethanolamine lipase isoform X2 [Folsomia candida]